MSRHCNGLIFPSDCQSLDKDCSLIRNPLLEATHAAAFNFEKYRYMPIGDSCVHNDIKKWDEGYTENTMEAAGLLNKIPIIHFTHAGFENLTTLQQHVWPYPYAMATTIGMYCLMAFLLTYRRRYISIMAYFYVALTFVVTVSIILMYTYLAQPKYPSSRVFETEIRIFDQDTWFTGIILVCFCFGSFQSRFLTTGIRDYQLFRLFLSSSSVTVE
ncbi:hypothetical protein ANCCAN_05842 [Ancylostoma caninum]|uniref:Uncharacterized protein n=1 Tax=Ancylostoma caninum TaxID=29170 RepID=A0A368GUV4_ANCCA|nr:hypothetical protein ANCCAN_05842 [Ancylostoma caninum]